MKKFLSLLLCSLFLFSMLTACSGNNQPSGDPEDEDEANNGYRDFYEEEFWAAFPIGTDSWNVFWPEPNTEEREQIRRDSEEIETKLNCRLKEDGFTSLGIKTFQTFYATGNYTYHWSTGFNSSGSPIYAFYKAGYLQSWNDIPTVDLTDAEKWGSPKKQSNATFNGELYLDVGRGSSGGAMGHMIYNQKLVEEFNAVEPQALFEQNNWTWATFNDYVNTVSVFTPERTVYAMSVWATNINAKVLLPLCSIFSNGGQVVDFHEDGTPYFALTDPNAMEALDWITSLYQTGTIILDTVSPPEVWATGGATFVLGDIAFGTSSSGSSKHWGLDNLEDIRFIPFPSGPKAEYGVTPTSYSTAATGTGLMFGVDKEDAGYVWNLKRTVELRYGEENDEVWIRKTFFSTESYNNYLLNTEDFNFDFSSQIGTDVTATLRQTLCGIVEGTTTAAEGFGQIGGLVEAAIAENIEAR